MGISSNFGNVDWEKLAEGWPFEMAVDWVRVYQDPDAYDVGCDTEDYPTSDYINRHLEAYTNPNLTIWGYTPEEGGYQSPWPKNKLYSKGCGTTANRMYPGDPDQAEVLAPNISSKSVTLGVYSYVEASTGGYVQSITKTAPNPTESGATNIHEALTTPGLARRSSVPEQPTEVSESQ